MFSMLAIVFSGLVQLLIALVGATVIVVGVQGFKAEWLALFKKPVSGVTARIFVYLLGIGLQAYNWYTHPGMPVLEFVVLAVMTVFCATGIYQFIKKR
jgi:hypothetical protein